MKKTKLVIEDQVNCRFYDLDPAVRRNIVEKMSFKLPYAHNIPSVQMGRWDGRVAFATVGGGCYINHLDRILPIVEAAGYEVELEDKRPPFSIDLPEIDDTYLSEYKWQKGHRLAGEPIILADHQVRAINAYVKNHQSIQSISTSAGKTIITAALAKMVGEASGGKRTLTIVPSKSLVKQTYADFQLIGLDVGMYFGDEKQWGHQHVVSTWQSLSVFMKKDRRGKFDGVADSFAAFIKDMICVVVDECHSAKAVELRRLLDDPRGCSNFPLRWGMTGTVPKDEYEFLPILGGIGPVVGEITAKELQDKGIMSNCHVHVKQMVDDMAFAEYPDAYRYLTSDRRRIKWIADYVMELQKTGNVLVLYDRYDTADLFKEMIPDLRIVNGEMPLKKREAIYSEFTDDTKIICAATYGVAAVGVNIPALHHVVLIEAGKSFTRSIQSIGRGLRRTAVKVFVDIHDICSTNKWSAKHLTERKKYFKDAKYPFKIEKIRYR